MAASDTPREPDSRFNQQERDHLSILYRRIEWLAKRAGSDKTSPAMLAWIKRELAALNWVLRKVKREA